MNHAPSPDTLAARLFEARRAGQTLSSADGALEPETADHAYAVQLRSIALRDSRELVKSGLSDKATVFRVKRLAIASLALWAFVIGAGRFLAYTYSRLTLSF